MILSSIIQEAKKVKTIEQSYNEKSQPFLKGIRSVKIVVSQWFLEQTSVESDSVFF